MLGLESEKRVEILRLIEQYLYENDYQDIASQLEQKSGILYESPNIRQLKNAIMERQFDIILASLQSFHFADHIYVQMHFAVSAFKYIELARAKDAEASLIILRNEVSVHPQSTAFIAQLTKLLIIDDAEALEEAIRALPASFPKTPQELLNTLMNLSPENFIIPDSRLEALLHQAQQFQVNQCAFHTSSNSSSVSLFRDHKCLQDWLQLTQVSCLQDAHGDEIWHLSASSGLLASCSKDKSGALWLTDNPESLKRSHRIESFRKPVSFSAISPSSKYCFFSAQDGSAFVLDSALKESVVSLSNLHSLNIVSAVFVDDASIITASEDQTIVWMSIAERTPKFRWTEINCHHLCLLGGGTVLAAACAPKLLIGISLQDHQEVFRVVLDDEVTFMSSDNSRYLLLSTLKSALLLFDAHGKKIVKRFEGHVNERFHIQNCFVGQNMVASGSEDGCLVIWHRESGSKVLSHVVQEGVSINAAVYDSGIFYVGGDDGRIRVLKFI